jgi:hypothetical protein
MSKIQTLQKDQELTMLNDKAQPADAAAIDNFRLAAAEHATLTMHATTTQTWRN